MSQNLLSISFTPEQLAAVETHLQGLEVALAGLISLNPDDRRTLRRMGAKSEQFCRQTLNVLEQNPQIVPPSLSVAELRADLAAIDALRPFLTRLSRLAERADDTEVALGSDVMSAALEGYGLLKVVGRNQGLDTLRKDLAVRFRKSARSTEDAEASA
ncbi:hypothetical protein [Tahibacter amnicola]|uniref:Uncharacterized protein n=1 Tax=Tahibacter amnicola TaxID=2976241 RepID=A0ABY6B9D0_9GAMM|nr:hypothetical protein [Tahibacter amnicola]UXI66157.1 hypothetical protein N4264_15520 [Tahibacter amnicola]